RGGGTAANPPGTAQDAAPVAQRSRRDRARLVRTRTVLLSRESRSRGGLSWLIRVEAAEDQEGDFAPSREQPLRALCRLTLGTIHRFGRRSGRVSGGGGFSCSASSRRFQC